MPETAAMDEQITKTEIRIRVDRDTGAPGRLLVAADRVDVPAVAGAAEHEVPEHEEHHEQHHDPRHALRACC